MYRFAQRPRADVTAGGARFEDTQPLARLLQGHFRFKARFDGLLVLAALLAFLSLYLPWLPGLYGAVPGWKVPYSTTDIPLDEIRHLENVVRPHSMFLLSFVGIVALVFSRTSRYVGIRDLLAGIVLVVGGGYVLIYFADEWAWCLLYHYVGPYAAFASLGLMAAAGLRRMTLLRWIHISRALLLLAAAFLITAWFLPWSLDHSGVTLLLTGREFYFLGSYRVYTLLMPIFPLLGIAAFLTAFLDLKAVPAFITRSWPLCFGLAATVYFRAVWGDYLDHFPLGSWGTLIGLTILTVAGVFHLIPKKPVLAKTLVSFFLVLNLFYWLSFMTGGRALELIRVFFSAPPRFRL